LEYDECSLLIKQAELTSVIHDDVSHVWQRIWSPRQWLYCMHCCVWTCQWMPQKWISFRQVTLHITCVVNWFQQAEFLLQFLSVVCKENRDVH